MVRIVESSDYYDVYEKEQKLPEINGATLLSFDDYQNIKVIHKFDSNVWWLRTPSKRKQDGEYAVICSSKYGSLGDVPISHYADVCPALKISNYGSNRLELFSTFEINGYEFKIISNDIAWLYKGNIGNTYFDEYSNKYGQSHIKKYVDDWFNTEIKPYV